MDIQALNREFQAGAYQDYNLAEYEFLRRFCELTRPQTITCVGGGTNLDLFYATQGLTPRVTNWDPGFQGVGQSSWRTLQARYQQVTDFQGEYEWLPAGVSNIKQINTAVDLLWLGHGIDLMDQIPEWPGSLVVGHYGAITTTPALMRAHRHLPMVALGKRIAVYSKQEHDWDHDTYGLSRDRALGPIDPVTEIVR